MRILLPLLLLAGAPALAQTPADTTAPAASTASTTGTAAVDPDADKQICRRPPSKASRIAAKKECHTKAEWAEIDKARRASTVVE